MQDSYCTVRLQKKNSVLMYRSDHALLLVILKPNKLI
jgi:hypothetical protein